MADGALASAAAAKQISLDDLDIAVIIPCMNEEIAIGGMVRKLRELLPHSRIFVYDNNSTDDTVGEAERAGAIVRREKRQGKGFVVRRMFADIDADIYMMVDGDNTYDIDAAPKLIQTLVDDGLDMVNGARKAVVEEAYRPGHAMGNKVLTEIMRRLFGKGFSDIFSGYRIFSRRFVKSFPVMSRGFEIETELTVHALELEMPFDEIETDFRDRPSGSESKLRTYSDGTRILWTMINLLRQEKPFHIFGAVAGFLALLSIIIAYPLFITYFETGLVPRFPTAILATGLMLLASLSLVSGLILDTVSYGRREAKRMRYLTIPGIHAKADNIRRSQQN